jgi:hypothetical protein
VFWGAPRPDALHPGEYRRTARGIDDVLRLRAQQSAAERNLDVPRAPTTIGANDSGRLQDADVPLAAKASERAIEARTRKVDAKADRMVQIVVVLGRRAAPPRIDSAALEVISRFHRAAQAQHSQALHGSGADVLADTGARVALRLDEGDPESASGEL